MESLLDSRQAGCNELKHNKDDYGNAIVNIINPVAHFLSPCEDAVVRNIRGLIKRSKYPLFLSTPLAVCIESRFCTLSYNCKVGTKSCPGQLQPCVHSAFPLPMRESLGYTAQGKPTSYEHTILKGTYPPGSIKHDERGDGVGYVVTLELF